MYLLAMLLRVKSHRHSHFQQKKKRLRKKRGSRNRRIDEDSIEGIPQSKKNKIQKKTIKKKYARQERDRNTRRMLDSNRKDSSISNSIPPSQVREQGCK